MIVVLLGVLIFFLHLLLKLNWVTSAVLFVLLLLMLPRHRKKYEEMKRQERRFHDAALYIDTLLYAFSKTGKIDGAMEEVAESLPEGSLRSCVERALNHIRLTFDESDIIRDGLAIVEQEYSCRRIRNIHEFMSHVEYYGGSIEQPVRLFLDEKEHWEKRIREAVQMRRKMWMDIVFSVCVSLGICGIVMHFPVMNVDISGHILTQVLAVIVILLDDLILQKSQNYLSPDWLCLEEDREDSYYEKKMESYHDYDEAKDRRLSLILGCIAGGITVGFFVVGNQWLGLLGMVLTILFFQQHKIGRRMARKSLVSGISCAFPIWLMDLVLLLQSENVQVALQKSLASVPGVLKRELELLVSRLQVSPESSIPYHEFLKEFELPEIHSAMSMLYALSIGNTGSANQQVGELVSRNQDMMDTVQAIRLKDRSGAMYGLFLAPVVTASVKLMTDMALFMMSFLSSAMI